jgi:hypothetical protein
METSEAPDEGASTPVAHAALPLAAAAKIISAVDSSTGNSRFIHSFCTGVSGAAPATLRAALLWRTRTPARAALGETGHFFSLAARGTRPFFGSARLDDVPYAHYA